jgi:GNAT superfamily N-acetyltransferase
MGRRVRNEVAPSRLPIPQNKKASSKSGRKTMPVNIRFYEPGEAEPLVTMAKRVFPIIQEIPPVFWEHLEQGSHKTVVAEADRQIVGAIPFDIRDFLIRPDVHIRAAFAHLVSVDAPVRAQGLGSQMMDFAKQKLPEFCDGMFVYTGHEGRKPYTFYERNHFIDLLYNRPFSRQGKNEDSLPAGITLSSLDLDAIPEEDLNTAYHRQWDRFAGFPLRYPGAWKKALTSLIYVEIPTRFYLSARRNLDRLEGFAILGVSSKQVSILEIADFPQEYELHLRAAATLAAQEGAATLHIDASDAHPILPCLKSTGFQPGPRAEAEIIAGQVFHFTRIWRQLAGEMPPFTLEIWTPQRKLLLPGSGPAYHLEMKEPVLQRLFLCRENLAHLIQSEQVTSPDSDLPFDQLQEIFAPSRWVYHTIDWI